MEACKTPIVLMGIIMMKAKQQQNWIPKSWVTQEVTELHHAPKHKLSPHSFNLFRKVSNVINELMPWFLWQVNLVLV